MKELFEKYIDKIANIRLGGLIVNVKVLDIKTGWGKTRFLVQPVEGAGQIWVEEVTLLRA